MNEQQILYQGTFPITESSYIHLNAALKAVYGTYGWKSFLGLQSFSLLLFLLIGMRLFFHNSLQNIIILFLFIIVIIPCIIYFLILHPYIRKDGKKYARYLYHYARSATNQKKMLSKKQNQTMFYDNLCISFYENELEVAAPLQNNRIHYELIQNLIQTNRYLLLTLNKSSAYLVDRTCFSEQEFENLCLFLEQKCKTHIQQVPNFDICSS